MYFVFNYEVVLIIYLEHYTLKKFGRPTNLLFLQNAVIFHICHVVWNNINQTVHLLEQLLNYRTSSAHMKWTCTCTWKPGALHQCSPYVTRSTVLHPGLSAFYTTANVCHPRSLLLNFSQIWWKGHIWYYYNVYYLLPKQTQFSDFIWTVSTSTRKKRRDLSILRYFYLINNFSNSTVKSEHLLK